MVVPSSDDPIQPRNKRTLFKASVPAKHIQALKGNENDVSIYPLVN
jgi:hypothetical protein